MITRSVFYPLVQRLHSPRCRIQVLFGPRESGKTTLAQQAIQAFAGRATYVSSDGPTAIDAFDLEQKWELARLECRRSGRWLLILDEVQRTAGWSAVARRLRDGDAGEGLDLRVLMIGSSMPLLDAGLKSDLQGLYDMTPTGHWSYAEIQERFGWTLDQYIYFGGYPRTAEMLANEEGWRAFLLEQVIETALARDVLLSAQVAKPSLLRSFFRLACTHSAEVLSFQKMTTQLPGAGNTTTLSGYLELLQGAGLVRGLQKFDDGEERKRGSIPKLQVFNSGLATALSGWTYESARGDGDRWGRLVESAIGAHLANAAVTGEIDDLCYWRERNRDVAFVIRAGNRIVALDVKAGQRKISMPGIEVFARAFRPYRRLEVGAEGIPVEEFLRISPRELSL